MVKGEFMPFEFINGAELVARAAMHAGCDFFAGYPISPATAIHLNLMREMPSKGRLAIQGEDEIASISMCIAASMAGKKTMTATSGPGISLYSENIGLAVMGEVPLVIVNVQRLGPATGGATTGAQGDIQFVRWVTSGGMPMVVLVPSSIESLYRLTIQAFNISEVLRTPVFLLTSKEMVLTRHTVDMDGMKTPEVINRTYFKGSGDFVPYACKYLFDVPPFLPIGADKPVRFTTSMHDSHGYLTKDPKKVKRKLLHLQEKIILNMTEFEYTELDEDPGSDTLIISYGVNTPVCQDVLKTVRNNGKKCSLLTLETLFPIPEGKITTAIANRKTIILPELNTGLYARSIKHLLHPGQEMISVTRLDGDIFATEFIMQKSRLL